MTDHYDVYGIGNALVDMVFEVHEDFLNKMKIDKGLMTLVDENRQSKLLDNLQGVIHNRSCGGSAANSMIAIASIGGKCFYSCKVANDETGDFYATDLEKYGVDSNLRRERPDGITGKCMVFVTPDADRTMNTFLGITQHFGVQELVESALLQSQYLYIEGYLVASQTARAAAIKAREIAKSASIPVSLTFSDPNMVQYFGQELLDIMGGKIDLLFCNDQEALTFAKTTHVSQAIEKLKNHASKFAITMGKEGALIFDGIQLHHIPTPQVDAVDTNGAGDLFAGTFLYAITHGCSDVKAAELACRCSARLVTQFGPRLTKEELLAVVQRAH